tara:strand:- start:222 stop:491 length:270 start_codon:yes stop_codon:yes gene_type:complete
MSIIGRRRPRNHNTPTNQLYFIQNSLDPLDDFNPLPASPMINEIDTSITQSKKNKKRKRMTKTFCMNKKVKKNPPRLIYTRTPLFIDFR